MFRTGVTIAAAALALAVTAGSARAGCQMQQIAEYHLTMDGNQPLVDATINGHPVRFIVDLGAWATMLSGQDAKRLGLAVRTMPGLQLEEYGVGGEAAARMAHVDDFALGPIDQKSIEMLVTGDRRFSSRAVGLLGQDLLTHADIEFDLAHNVMRLMQPVGCKGDDVVYWAQSYSMAPILDSRRGASVQVNVQLNGHTFEAQMDTGAGTSTVTTDAASIAGAKTDTGADAQPEILQGIGDHGEASTVAVFSSFSVGGETIKNARLRVADMYGHDTRSETGSHVAQKLVGFSDMLLGADFFLSHRVYIARNQGKVYFTYAGGPVFQVVAAHGAGDLDQRIRDDDKAIATDPSGADAFEDRGHIYEQKGDTDKALADYDRAAALQPDDADYRNETCWARGYAGRELDKALPDCNAAVALTVRSPSGSADSLDSRGLVWFRLGDLGKAIADYDAALRANPKLASALYMRGVIKHRKGDAGGGDADIAAAKALAPAVADIYAKAGIAP